MGSGLSMSSVNKIKELAAAREYSLALDIIESQDLTKSLNPQFLRTCGEVYTATGRYVDARRTLLMAHKLAPEAKRIMFSLIELYYRMGYFILAQTYYDIYMFDADMDNSETKQLMYIREKAVNGRTEILYEQLGNYYIDNLDYEWSFETFLLYCILDKKDKVKMLVDDYLATYKNTEYGKLMQAIIDGQAQCRDLFYVYADCEKPDVSKEEAELRKLEEALLKADELRIHPPEPEITIMVDDYEESTIGIKRKLKKFIKEQEQLQADQKKLEEEQGALSASNEDSPGISDEAVEEAHEENKHKEGLFKKIFGGRKSRDEGAEENALNEAEVSEEKVDSDEAEVSEETIDSNEIEISEETIDSDEAEVSEEIIDSNEIEISEEKVDPDEAEVSEEIIDSDEAEISEETVDSDEEMYAGSDAVEGAYAEKVISNDEAEPEEMIVSEESQSEEMVASEIDNEIKNELEKEEMDASEEDDDFLREIDAAFENKKAESLLMRTSAEVEENINFENMMVSKLNETNAEEADDFNDEMKLEDVKDRKKIVVSLDLDDGFEAEADTIEDFDRDFAEAVSEEAEDTEAEDTEAEDTEVEATEAYGTEAEAYGTEAEVEDTEADNTEATDNKENIRKSLFVFEEVELEPEEDEDEYAVDDFSNISDDEFGMMDEAEESETDKSQEYEEAEFEETEVEAAEAEEIETEAREVEEAEAGEIETEAEEIKEAEVEATEVEETEAEETELEEEEEAEIEEIETEAEEVEEAELEATEIEVAEAEEPEAFDVSYEDEEQAEVDEENIETETYASDEESIETDTPDEDIVEEDAVEGEAKEESTPYSNRSVFGFQKEKKSSLDFPVFKSSLFPTYHNEKPEINNNFNQIMDEAQNKLRDNMLKEEQMQREAEELLASLGISLGDMSIVKGNNYGESITRAEPEAVPRMSRNELKKSLLISDKKKNILKKLKEHR